MQVAFDQFVPLTAELSPVRSPPDAHSDPQILEDVASQFEGLFVSMLLKEMRQTLQEGLFSGDQSDSYGALFDLYLGQHLADQGALGIRQTILAQYQAGQYQAHQQGGR
jgi:Rod binding domain-containing protein